MIDAIHITESPAAIAAVIRFKIPQMELPSVMGPAIDELMATIKAQGLEPAGPVFNHYLNMDLGMFEIEVGVPVASEIAPTGRVELGHLPAVKVMRATYRGPYSGLHLAWREFGELAKVKGHKASGDLWESYIYGPESNPDPTTWRTELNQPLQ